MPQGKSSTQPDCLQTEQPVPPQIKQLISIANAKINFSGEYINTQAFIGELMGSLGDLHSSSGNNEVAGLLGKVDFSNLDEIEAALNKSKDAG